MSDDERTDAPSVLDIFQEWYHVPTLLIIAVAMLAVRLQSYSSFVRDDGTVVFSGNDAWYHLRQVRYTVRHWPDTMPFDPWTYFPYGTTVGQFGTVYDQLVATAALVVGLGSPSETLVAKTLLVAPAVFGALAVVPVYLIGKRIAGRGPAVFGVVVLALLPGTFLRRTLVGFADHNGAEPFFMGLAVAALLAAFAVAERERPIWALVAARDFDELRTPTAWAVLAGGATALYMWAWPPGVLLVGVVGVFLLLKLPSDYLGDRSPEHVAYAVAVSMTVTAVLMLVPIQRVGFAVTDFSLLHVALPFGGAVTAVAYAGLARLWDERDLPEEGYPVAVYGSAFVGLGLVAVLLPSVFKSIVFNLQRTVGFSAGAATRTIAEAQPYLAPSVLQQQGFVTQSGAVDRVGRIMSDYGFTLFTGVVAAVWLAAKPLVRDGDSRRTTYAVASLAVIALIYLVPGLFGWVADQFGTVSEVVGLAVVAALVAGATVQRRYEAETLFYLVWAAVVTSAAFTQVRFNYYLVLVVATANAYLIGELFRHLDLTSVVETAEEIEPYQVIAVVAVVMLVLAPGLIWPMQVRHTGNPAFDDTRPVWVVGESASPGGYENWEDSLLWMRANTPAEGNLGGANNSDSFGYYDRFKRVDDYEYPEGTYGVQSWWDYGHWITVGAERIPNANPFQQGATEAANYLLAPNESAAERTLERRSSEGERTRYVMVDWQMVEPGSKFGAPIVWYDRSNLSTRDFYRPVYPVVTRGGQTQFNSRLFSLVRTQRYYNSTMIRLYYYHGSAQSPQPVVVDWQRRQVPVRGGTATVNGSPTEGRLLKTFQSMQAARQFVANDSSSQIGGIGPFPSERVPALEHYRLVDVSQNSALNSSYRRIRQRNARALGLRQSSYGVLDANPQSYVKTFERVPGATLRGSNARPNGTVTAEVPLYIPQTNTSFTYTQRTRANADGEFTMTLPYATTGYDEYGPAEGYTNTSIRATGPYNVTGGVNVNESGYITVRRAQVNVSEGAVVGAENRTVTVELERNSQPVFGGSGGPGSSGGSGGSGGSNGSGTDESGDSGTVNVSDGSAADLRAPGPGIAPAVRPTARVV